jgi:hypothetical protein
VSPTIRIDDEVYKWLQSQAVPFDDSPNSVLRRIAGLDDTRQKHVSRGILPEPAGSSLVPLTAPSAILRARRRNGQRDRLARGNKLIVRWKIPARQARFRRDGTWFAPLTRFPAALCDCTGYVVFETAADLALYPYIKVHPSGQITAERGISIIPGYVKVDDPIEDPYEPGKIEL